MKNPSSPIIFEHPLNEQIRICLRLENLFKQVNEQIHSNAPCVRTAIIALLHILDIIERPDLKSKITQILMQQASSLAQLEQFPQVDNVRLKSFLSELHGLIANLHARRGRFGERLRSNEFLNQIKLQLGTQGGICYVKSPAFMLWLNRPRDVSMNDLRTWMTELDELHRIVDIIIKLLRESTEPQKLISMNGFHDQPLDPSLPPQLIRIAISTELNTVPEFSVGKHRLMIRFLVPNYHENGRPTQLCEMVPFELSCCRL